MSDVTLTAPCPSCGGTLSAELKLEHVQQPALFTGLFTECQAPVEIRVQLQIKAGDPRHVARPRTSTNGSDGG
jgi:hypothetical protein